DALKKAGVEVWTSSSRDQAQIIRTLVDDDFMERYNIPINVKLVTGDTLLPATLAGTGPDVSMGNAQSTPINYAIRSAVLSLNDTNGGYDFNDFSKYENNPVYKDILDDVDTFDEVTKRFAPTAMVPLTLYGKAYGIPENMSFSMMFYRKDIFAEQNIKVPDTWDDFKAIISTLQAKTMDIGFPTGVGGSTILMYQQGEKMYDEGNYDSYLADYPELFADGKNTYTDENGKVIPKTDGMTINLDSDIALSTFNDVCKYFTNYSFPVTYTFPDRFRNGTMPLGILDYTTYNTLIVFAPEIKGLWEFTPLPGTKSADGSTINNTSVASVSAMIMMRSVTDDNAFSAWTFMQWWTSAKIQSSYANEMEALLGPSAKQNTANIEALELMAWSKDELDSLKAQFNAVTCTPEYPGSYIIGRYTNFAFLGVYN
ncbi:MAG: extracellular solute-binding protein, partial [Clostridia bacterium]